MYSQAKREGTQAIPERRAAVFVVHGFSDDSGMAAGMMINTQPGEPKRMPAANPGEPSNASCFWTGAWPLVVLLALAILPYIGVLRNDFAYAYDDKAQILDNPYVHSFHHLRALLTQPIWKLLGAQPLAGYYRPVATVGFLFCYQLFGPWACGYHMLSLLLNAAVVLLLFVVAERLIKDQRTAFVAAALFAVHPAHIEPVAWISASMDLEMTLFYLLAFWCFLRMEGRTGAARLAMQSAACTSFALALLAKEPAVTLPVLATIYEHAYRGDRSQTSLRQKLSRYGPLWLIGLAYACLRVRMFGTFAHPPGLHPLTVPQVILSALALIGGYFALLLFPLHLSALYEFHPSTHLDLAVLAGAAALVLSGIAFACLWKRARPASFAIVWLYLTLAPVLDARLMGVYVRADRYLYLPSAGFCLLAGGAFAALWHSASSHPAWHTTLVAAGATVMALCVLRIGTRVPDWQTDITIFRQALRAAPDDYRIHDALGLAYWIRNDAQDAESEWRRTLRLEPNSIQTLDMLGALYAQRRQFDFAVPLLERSLSLYSKDANAHLNLGAAFAEMGNTDAAEQQFRAAIALSPLNFMAHNLLGKLYFDSHRLGEAEQQFRQSLQCEPNLAAYDHLGYIYLKEQNPDLAAQSFRAALAMNTLDSRAHFGLGQVYDAGGRHDEARQEMQAALAADPHNAEIRSALEKLDR